MTDRTDQRLMCLHLIVMWIFLGLTSAVPAQESGIPQDAKPDTSKKNLQSVMTDLMRTVESPEFRIHENRAFKVGEKLVFDIAWGPVLAGHGILSIPDTVWIAGRPCYHVVTSAKSSNFFDLFYRVRDRVESVIDIDGCFPWRFIKKTEEGRYKGSEVIDFDQINHRTISNNRDTVDVPPYIQGILSSFYFTRTLDLEVGKHFELDNFGGGKIYPLRVLIHRKERIKVPAGRFDCIVVEPVMRVEGIFQQTGKLTIWLTDDEKKIPVLVKSKIKVGSIDIRLRKIESL